MASLRYLCNYMFWTSPCVRRAFCWCLFGAWKWVFADLYRKKVIEDAGTTWLNMLLISGFVRYNYIFVFICGFCPDFCAEVFRVLWWFLCRFLFSLFYGLTVAGESLADHGYRQLGSNTAIAEMHQLQNRTFVVVPSEHHLWALYPSHLTCSSHIFSDLAQDLGTDWSEELEVSSRE